MINSYASASAVVAWEGSSREIPEDRSASQNRVVKAARTAFRAARTAFRQIKARFNKQPPLKPDLIIPGTAFFQGVLPEVLAQIVVHYLGSRDMLMQLQGERQTRLELRAIFQRFDVLSDAQLNALYDFLSHAITKTGSLTYPEVQVLQKLRHAGFDPVRLNGLLAQVHHLHLSGSEIENGELLVLTIQCVNLRELDVSDCRLVTQVGLQMRYLTKITKLNVVGCQLPDRWYESLWQSCGQSLKDLYI